MKFQFRTTTLLYATVFVAIACAGVLGLQRGFHTGFWNDISIGFFVCFIPVWVPIVFLAYALGRRALNPKILIAFAVVELVAVLVVHYYLELMANSSYNG